MRKKLPHYSGIDFIKGVLILLMIVFHLPAFTDSHLYAELFVYASAASVRGSASYRPGNAQTLWYLQPAESHGVKNAWMEYYLPLGNGHLGAMVGGGVEREVVQLNEKTLWDGSATVYGDYQNLGYLYLEDQRPTAASDYHFALDLTTATAEVEWENAEGISFRTCAAGRRGVWSFIRQPPRPGPCICSSGWKVHMVSRLATSVRKPGCRPG